jgi:ADP-heptose:LPS heptosyltransferase
MQQANLTGLYQRTRTAKKILVVDLGFLGDSVHLVPSLWEIKRQYPAAKRHTLSAAVGAELLRMAPCVDRPWTFPLGSPSPPWWRHWDVIRALRRERFDLVFNLSGADRSVFLTALTGAKWRVAYAGGRKHFWNEWLIPDWIPRLRPDLPVYEQRRQMLAACGLELGPARWDLRLPEAAKARAESLTPAGAIHFSINASTPLKEWPLSHWIELAKLLLAGDTRLRIAATGSASVREQERLHALAKAVANERLSTLPPGLPIAELGAVLQRCRLHIGADSGVLHLAMALGLPTLALFRDYAGTHEWLPRGTAHRHLLAPCACANSHEQPCVAKGEAMCLAQITPEQVTTTIRSF